MLRSIELEPLNPHFQYCLATLYGSAGRWDDCYVALTKLCEMDSTFNRQWIRNCLISYYEAKEDTGKGMQLYRQSITESKPGSNEYLWYQFRMNNFAGRKSDATKYLRLCEALKGKEAMSPYQLSLAYAVFQDKETTMHWLEKMYETHDAQLVWAYNDVQFDFLRGDPRFEALMRKAGYRDLIAE
jgi:hypothetical protein